MVATAESEAPKLPAPSDADRPWVSWVVARRVHITSLIFAVVVGECVVSGVKPHDLANPGDPNSLLGLAFVLAGLAVRSWAAGILHKTSQLTTIGPYSLIRNPLYVGSLLLMAGFGALIDQPLVWVAMTPLVALFVYTVRKEERLLAERFGEAWQEYARTTPRFVPRRLFVTRPGNWRFQQWLGNREYQAASAALVGLVALKAWQMA